MEALWLTYNDFINFHGLQAKLVETQVKNQELSLLMIGTSINKKKRYRVIISIQIKLHITPKYILNLLHSMPKYKMNPQHLFTSSLLLQPVKAFIKKKKKRTPWAATNTCSMVCQP